MHVLFLCLCGQFYSAVLRALHKYASEPKAEDVSMTDDSRLRLFARFVGLTSPLPLPCFEFFLYVCAYHVSVNLRWCAHVFTVASFLTQPLHCRTPSFLFRRCLAGMSESLVDDSTQGATAHSTTPVLGGTGDPWLTQPELDSVMKNLVEGDGKVCESLRALPRAGVLTHV